MPEIVVEKREVGGVGEARGEYIRKNGKKKRKKTQTGGDGL